MMYPLVRELADEDAPDPGARDGDVSGARAGPSALLPVVGAADHLG